MKALKKIKMGFNIWIGALIVYVIDSIRYTLSIKNNLDYDPISFFVGFLIFLAFGFIVGTITTTYANWGKNK